MEMETGKVVVEKVGGKSRVTRCFSKYPVKFIIPNKVSLSLNPKSILFTCIYRKGEPFCSLICLYEQVLLNDFFFCLFYSIFI
uniref:Uncharacterized protein n=1 Tax=Rhizophora mucronata TaxID=61149 RepID=A0A2P2JBR3_RHIMU